MSLQRAGLIERRPTGNGRGGQYHLSPAGLSFRPVVEALGRWGCQWAAEQLRPDNLDAGPLTWFLRPGGSTGWHVHPGRALITVKTGQLTLHRAKGCRARTFSAGQTFLELGPGDVNLTRNQTAAVTEAVVTFLLPVGRPDHGGCARPQLPAVASTEITRSG